MKKIVVLFILLTFPVLSVYASDNITMGKLKQLESHAVSQEKRVNLSNLKKQPQRLSAKNVSLDNNSVKPAANAQLQKEQAILKKLKAQSLQKQSASNSNPFTAVSHQCPIHKRASHLTPPLPAAKQPPAYKFYSAKYKVPPPPKRISYSHHKTSTVLKVMADAFAKPDVITKIAVSNTDVNRIVSPEPIKDVVYSKEKGLLVHFIGKNAFIKFVIKRNADGSYTYIQQPAEIYVVTPDAVYTIIVSPQNIAGRTIRLSGGNLKKISANKQMFVQLPYEKKLIKIIKAVYKNNIPYTWDVVHPQNPKPIVINDFLFVTPLTLVSIEGTGFSLKEYKVTSPMNMRISENDFITVKLAKNPRAIALTGFNVSKDNPVYLFIVTRGGKNE